MQKGLCTFFCNFSFLMIVKYWQFYLLRLLKTIIIDQYRKGDTTLMELLTNYTVCSF